MGKDIARGINVEKWTTCIYAEEIKTTIKATWTWSDNNTWTTSYKGRQFPIEMTVESSSDSGLNTIEKYEYTSYRPFIAASPEIFEVICFFNQVDFRNQNKIKCYEINRLQKVFIVMAERQQNHCQRFLVISAIELKQI